MERDINWFDPDLNLEDFDDLSQCELTSEEIELRMLAAWIELGYGDAILRIASEEMMEKLKNAND